MKRKDIKCPYCGANAVIRSASVVHGERAKDELLCVCSRYPKCDSYVGVHKHSKQPFGTLADKNLRRKRQNAHLALDGLWQSGLMQRWQAYVWLQAKLGLNKQQTHIALFSEYLCDEVISLCNDALRNNNLAA